MTLMTASRKMLPTMHDFCTTIPLYEEFPLLEAHYLDVEKLAKRDFIIDCFCVGCDNDSVFISPEQSSHFSLNVIPHSDQVFMREFRCPRNTQHRIIFHFLVADQQLIKVGQHPSVADLSAAD